MRILLTAFEPYAEWPENSSWLALVELLKNRPSSVDLITRRYPVDLPKLRERLDQDLQHPLDAVIHLGQAPGSPAIRLEALAVNSVGCITDQGKELPTLVESGPVAFRSGMPLGRFKQTLGDARIPAEVSYHAGTFLCNAVMYLTHLRFYQQQVHTPVAFIHLPLATEQVVAQGRSMPSLPAQTLAQAVRLAIEEVVRWQENGALDNAVT